MHCVVSVQFGDNHNISALGAVQCIGGGDIISVLRDIITVVEHLHCTDDIPLYKS